MDTLLQDSVDILLGQWGRERPELNLDGLEIVVRVMHLAKTFAREANAALAPLGLELWEYDALSALRRQGKPFALLASELARETRLSTGAMTNRIDRLEKKGAVRRKPDPEDGRAVRVSLTPAGRRLIDQAIQKRLDAAQLSVGVLPAADRSRLADLLRELGRAGSDGSRAAPQ